MKLEHRPVNETKKSYAERISPQRWIEFEPQIRDLHRSGKTREQILAALNDTGFYPTLDQLNRKMRTGDFSELLTVPNSGNQHPTSEAASLSVATETFLSSNGMGTSPKPAQEIKIDLLGDREDETVFPTTEYRWTQEKAQADSPANDSVSDLKQAFLERNLLQEHIELIKIDHLSTKSDKSDSSDTCIDQTEIEWPLPRPCPYRSCAFLAINQRSFHHHLQFCHPMLPAEILFGVNQSIADAHDAASRQWVNSLDFANEAAIFRVADFLSASRLFVDAFNTFYLILQNIRDTPVNSRDSATTIRALCGCMRTAVTKRQILYARNLADVFLAAPHNHTGELHWIHTHIRRQKAALVVGAVYQSDPVPSLGCGETIEPFLRSDSGIDLNGTSREVMAFWLENGMEWKFPIRETWHGALDQKTLGPYVHSTMGMDLLMWCFTVIRATETVGRRFACILQASGGLHVGGFLLSDWRQILADSLFRLLLELWRESPPSSPGAIYIFLGPRVINSLEQLYDNPIFQLEEALAALSEVIISKIGVSSSDQVGLGRPEEAGNRLLRVVEANKSTPFVFNILFLSGYFERIMKPAAHFSPTSWARPQASINASRTVASRLASTREAKSASVQQIEFNQTAPKIREELKWASGFHSALPITAPDATFENQRDVPLLSTQPEQLRTQSQLSNDPLMSKRRSNSSSIRSHLSAMLVDRLSFASGENRNSKASSRMSWRLSAYLPISDHVSTRGSAVEAETTMMSIEE